MLIDILGFTILLICFAVIVAGIFVEVHIRWCEWKRENWERERWKG